MASNAAGTGMIFRRAGGAASAAVNTGADARASANVGASANAGARARANAGARSNADARVARAENREPYDLSIFFMRHAKSCSNMLRKDYELEAASKQLKDPPLSAQGIAHAQLYKPTLEDNLRSRDFNLGDATIASSELIRAQQTARILFGMEKRLHILPYLAETGDIPENTRRESYEQVSEMKRTLGPLFPHRAILSESTVEENVGPRTNTSSQTDKGDWSRFKRYISSSDFTLPRQGSMIIVGHGAYLTEVYKGLREEKELPSLDVKLNNMDGFLVKVTGAYPAVQFKLISDDVVPASPLPPSEEKDKCPARTEGIYPPFPLDVAEYPELGSYKTELDNLYDAIMHESPLPISTDPYFINEYLQTLDIHNNSSFSSSRSTVKTIFLKMYNLAHKEPIWPPVGYDGPPLYAVPGYTVMSQSTCCSLLLFNIGYSRKFSTNIIFIELKRKIDTIKENVTFREDFTNILIEFLTPTLQLTEKQFEEWDTLQGSNSTNDLEQFKSMIITFFGKHNIRIHVLSDKEWAQLYDLSRTDIPKYNEEFLHILAPPVTLDESKFVQLQNSNRTINNEFTKEYFDMQRLYNMINSSKDIADFKDKILREEYYTEQNTTFITSCISKETITQKLSNRYQQVYVIVPSSETNMNAKFVLRCSGGMGTTTISFNDTRWLQFPPGTFKEEPELQSEGYKGAMVIQGFKLFEHPDIKRALETGPPSATHPDVKRMFPELWSNEDLPYNLDYIEGIQYPKDMLGELASSEFETRYKGDEVYTVLRRKLNYLLLQKTGKSLTGNPPEELFKALTKQELEQAIKQVTTADIKAVIDTVRATYMLNKEGKSLRSDPVLTSLERLDQLARISTMELAPLVRRLRTWRNMYTASGRPAELITPLIDLLPKLDSRVARNMASFLMTQKSLKKELVAAIEPIYWALKGMHSFAPDFNKAEADRLSPYISETLKNAALQYFRSTETRALLENKVVSSTELKKLKDAIYNARLNREILKSMDHSIKGFELRPDDKKTIADENLVGAHDTIIFVAASRTCNDALHDKGRGAETIADPPFTFKGKQILFKNLQLIKSTNDIHKSKQYRKLGDTTWIIGSSPRSEAIKTLEYITEDICKNNLNIFPFVNNTRKDSVSTEPPSAFTKRNIKQFVKNGLDDLREADLHKFIEWLSANRSIFLKKDITTDEFHPEVLKYLVVTHKDTLTSFLQEEGENRTVTFLDAVEVTLRYIDNILQPLEVNEKYSSNPLEFRNDAGCETMTVEPRVFTAKEQELLEGMDPQGALMNSNYEEGTSVSSEGGVLFQPSRRLSEISIAGNAGSVTSDDSSTGVSGRRPPIVPQRQQFLRGRPVTVRTQSQPQSLLQPPPRYGSRQTGGDYGSYDQQSYRSASEIILKIFYSKLIKPEYIARTPMAASAASAAVESPPSPATKPNTSDIAVNLDILSNLADIDPKLACKQILNAPQNPDYTELKTLLGIKEEAGWFGKSLKCPKPGAFETIIGSYKKSKQYTDTPINILKRFLAYANNPKVTDEKVYKKFDALREQIIAQIPEKYATVKTELRNVKSVKGFFGTTYPPRKLILQYFEPLMILLQSKARPEKEIDNSSTAASRAYELDKIYDIADSNPKAACEAILRNPTYFTDLAKRLQITKKDGWFSDTLTCPPTNRIKQEILAYKKDNGLPIIDSKSKILERFMFFTQRKVTGDQILKKFKELAKPFIPANHIGFSYSSTTPVATLQDALSSMIGNTEKSENPVIAGQTGGRKYKTAAPTRKMKKQRGGGVTMPLGFFQDGAQMRGTYGSETGAGLGVMTANMARSAILQTGGRKKKATRKQKQRQQRGGFAPSAMGSFTANGLSLLPVASFMGYRMMNKTRKGKAGRTGRKRQTRR